VGLDQEVVVLDWEVVLSVVLDQEVALLVVPDLEVDREVALSVVLD
jgi:hypothetical protein